MTALPSSDQELSKPGWSVQRFLPRHFRILELCLEGKSNVDIAKEVGMHQVSVGLIVRSPTFQDELAKRRSVRERDEGELRQTNLVQAKSVLEKGALNAAEVQVGLLGSEKEQIKLAASNSILDRVFGQEKGQGPAVTINAETVQLLNLAVSESRAADG